VPGRRDLLAINNNTGKSTLTVCTARAGTLLEEAAQQALYVCHRSPSGSMSSGQWRMSGYPRLKTRWPSLVYCRSPCRAISETSGSAIRVRPRFPSREKWLQEAPYESAPDFSSRDVAQPVLKDAVGSPSSADSSEASRRWHALLRSGQ
jgi:hypothetical protein